MLRPFSHPVACCCVLGVVVRRLKLVKRLSQQLPTFLLFLYRRSVAQQLWSRLHSSSNIVWAPHAHYIWSPWRQPCINMLKTRWKPGFCKFTMSYLSYPSFKNTALFGDVSSVCTPMSTPSQHLPNQQLDSCCVCLDGA